jgi:hypothetical protein
MPPGNWQVAWMPAGNPAWRVWDLDKIWNKISGTADQISGDVTYETM